MVLSSAPYKLRPRLGLHGVGGSGRVLLFHSFDAFPLISLGVHFFQNTLCFSRDFHKFIFKRKISVPGSPQAPKNMLK